MKFTTISVCLVAFSGVSVEAKIRGLTINKANLTSERKLTQVMGYGAEPAAWRYPLKLCEGDCDNDSQCEGDLVCHQRNKNEKAPGCNGGETFDADTDFCGPASGVNTDIDVVSPAVEAPAAFAETPAPAPSETPVPSPAQTYGPGILQLEFVADDVTSGLPLGLCQGDCDTDEDCLDEYVCFQRELFEPVPGCAGQGDASIDYCTKSLSGQVVVTSAPVPAPTMPLQPVGGSVVIDDFPLLTTVGDNMGLPLGLCEGDCDSDNDCLDNLKCFQRDMLDLVPGCSGEGRISYDYCILGSPTPVGTAVPAVPAVITMAPSFSISGPVVELNPLRPPLDFVGDLEFSVIGNPLGFCQGDCDTDDDCLDNLICFERDAFENVPGCSGSGMDGVDYCTFSSVDGGYLVSMAPQPTGTLPPELQGANLPVIETVGDNLSLPLGMCQGDCDNDEDCLDELVCFQRDLLDPVPGCNGEGQISYDYCTVAPGATLPPTTQTITPAMRPTNAPGVPVAELRPLETVGDALELPLGICQGDCDTDDDCLDDLICFQRNFLEPVEGCSGVGQVSYDYCTRPIGATPTPTTAPVAVPDSVSASQLPPLESVSNDGNPIGLCQGDCDTDEDCLDEFVCFQRDFLEPVPGCSGLGARSYDYCIVDLLSGDPLVPANTDSPVLAPSLAPGTPADSLPQLVVVGDSLNLPLGMCEGDCDSNDDCLDELVCFQRDLLEPVPGCGGEGRTSYDYCTVDASSGVQSATTAPVDAPTMGVGETPVMPSVDGPQLVEISDEGDLPLGLCEGDCDEDSDCLDAMICFQRNYFEPVPGCSGTGRASFDYCIPNPNPDAPTTPPLTVSPATPVPVPLIPATSENPNQEEATVDQVVVVGAQENPEDAWQSEEGQGSFGQTAVESAQELPPLVIVDNKKNDKDKGNGAGEGTVGVAGDDGLLGLCEGKCKYTDDCGPGLFCFNGGSGATSVPGCSGDPGGYSFCIPVPSRKLKGVRKG